MQIIDSDLEYKVQISYNFQKFKTSTSYLDRMHLENLIQVQGIYSFFRIKLLDKLANYLYTMINEANSIFKENKAYGKSLILHILVIIDFFCFNMEKYNNKGSPYSRALYEEIIQSLLDIKKFI